MRLRSRGVYARLVLGLVVGIVTAWPGDSSAQTVATDVALFTGVALQVTPAVLLTSPPNGTYQFSGSCVVSVDAAVPPPPGPTVGQGGCGISGSGTFINLICGTGTVAGSAKVTESGEADPATATYSIAFVANLGTVTGTWQDDGAIGALIGQVAIVPIGGDCVTQAVSEFEVSGWVAAETPIATPGAAKPTGDVL